MKFICSHNAYTVCSKHPYKSTSNRLTRKKRTQHAIAGGKKGEKPTERTKGRKEKRRKRCGVRTETLGTERRELSAGRTPIAATTVGKVEAKVEANASPPPLSADFSAERRRGDLERTKEAEGRGSVLQGAGQSLAAGTMGLQWGHVWGQGGALPKLHGGGEEGKKGGAHKQAGMRANSRAGSC